MRQCLLQLNWIVGGVGRGSIVGKKVSEASC